MVSAVLHSPDDGSSSVRNQPVVAPSAPAKDDVQTAVQQQDNELERSANIARQGALTECIIACRCFREAAAVISED